MQGKVRVWESNRGMPQLKSPISRLSSARQAGGRASSAFITYTGEAGPAPTASRSWFGVDAQPATGALLALGMEADQLRWVQAATG